MYAINDVGDNKNDPLDFSEVEELSNNEESTLVG